MNPTVFFSHSSFDKPLLILMKELVLGRTENSIEVFLSSDGQSIPFGRNWVYQIQEALNRTKLMFVFITPSAVGSHWMLFEAGYAYSKGMRVVPVGMMGLDIGALSPPLSLLQGFNINSLSGLSNIVAVVNKTFATSFGVEFTQSEYDSLMEKAGLFSAGPLGPHGIYVDNVTIRVAEQDGLKTTPDQAMAEIARLLKDNNYEFQGSGKLVEMPGLSLYIESSHAGTPIVFMIDPSLMHISVPVINRILYWCMKSSARGVNLHLRFADSVACLRERYKVSARLHGTDVKAKDTKQFTLNDVDFNVGRGISLGRGGGMQEGNVILTITVNEEKIDLGKLVAIIDLLFERDILYFTA